MISIIITGYKEPKTIGRAIESFQKQKINGKYEIWVVAPDKETLNAAKKYKVNILQDPGKGKPTALNLVMKKVKKSDILILTDGDVYVSENSVNLLVDKITKKVGAVSGRPVSVNPLNKFFGYVSHLLTDIGNDLRIKLVNEGKFIVCSGYLYAIKNGIFKEMPENILSDDAYISRFIANKGYKIDYEPKAEVYVKYPENFKDWVKQKKRSTGGYEQLKEFFSEKTMRSFSQEATGVFDVLRYPKSIKEFIWTILLIKLRLYLWIRIFIDVRIRKLSFEKTWVRIESTKSLPP
ncbi:MAG: glycosyltransferase [Candidatus Nanoarchaeia archaeon]|nr:glycosyltransferase [Candidatus Nanoarchaeia archaeon]MDD5587618.1 glycosyltransferase [Candidatus Nanoarchaeia archaeon]